MIKKQKINLPLTVIYLATMFPIYKFCEVGSTFRPMPRNSPMYPDIKKNHMLNSVHVVELCCHMPLGIRYFWGVIHNPAFVTTGSFAVLGGFTTPIKLFKPKQFLQLTWEFQYRLSCSIDRTRNTICSLR